MGKSLSADQLRKKLLMLHGLRYAVACCLMLGLKVLIASLLSFWLTPVAAYLIVHVIVFFVSYAIHSKFTFNVPRTRQSLSKYFQAVVVFKIIDVAGFTLLSSYGLDTLASILIASAFEFVIRFVLVRGALFKLSAKHETTSVASPAHSLNCLQQLMHGGGKRG